MTQNLIRILTRNYEKEKPKALKGKKLKLEFYFHKKKKSFKIKVKTLSDIQNLNELMSADLHYKKYSKKFIQAEGK